MRLLIKTCLAATLAGILVVPTAHASIILDFFPASTFNPDTSAMDAALGITGFTIDDFSSTTLTPGLTIALSGGVTATTWTTLPNLFNQNVCGTLSTASWAGMYAATNSVTNQLDSCTSPSGLAQLTTFNYAPGTTFFGIGLANFQSLDSPENPITNHELFVNGVDMGEIETLAGAEWSPGVVLNAYLVIDATNGSSITSVGFENLSASPADFLGFSELAVQTSAVPEPSSGWLLLFGAIPGAFRLFRRAAR
jgi:hypothetical protein